MTHSDALDTTDRALLSQLEREFVFTGKQNRESGLMHHALRKHGNLHDAAEDDTLSFRKLLSDFAEYGGHDPALTARHRLLVVPDYRFGAHSREWDGRYYILVNAGTLHLLSFLCETDLIEARAIENRQDALTTQLADWCARSSHLIAVEFGLHPFGLPNLRAYMDDKMNTIEYVLLNTAELFVYLHEFAHIELGHLGHGFGHHGGHAAPGDKSEEFAADRHAVDTMLAKNEAMRIGLRWMFDKFCLLEAFGFVVPNSSVSFRERRNELARAYPQYFDASTDSGTTSIEDRIAPQEEIAKLHWTCKRIASTCNIQPDAGAPDTAGDDDDGYPQHRLTEVFPSPRESMRVVRLLEQSTDLERIQELLQTSLSLVNEWDEKRRHVQQHPILMGEVAQAWLKVQMAGADDKRLYNILDCERVWLERCAAVGCEHAWPVHEVVGTMLLAGSLDESIALLRAHPHVLSETGEARANVYFEELCKARQFDAALRANSVVQLIATAHSMGLDDSARYLAELPPGDPEIGRLALRLEHAIAEGNILEQFEICESALALAGKERAFPTWALVFREHRQGLPDF